ncbi:hypothetical protein Clocel_0127 [Clostridium cellulovorans 743B]|uniref:Uncharacterized protein n=1 Tax=Clostridium cellulovorans (strain ATCC 35296 / DSM 3052 / OCM 3 / 743B) TaxID=573061 RepID=D9SNP5_CLOC7|nr:hypothetical protein Clocel_0127 [Clostridium cellulovorans 743B]
MKNNVIYVDFSKPSRTTSKKKSPKASKVKFISKIKTFISNKIKKIRVSSKHKNSPNVRIK